MTDRRPHDLGHLAIGAICGAMTGAIVAGFLRPLFAVPSGGVGYITVHRYPKEWDIAVAALIVLGSFLGSLLAARRAPQPETRGESRPRWMAAAAVVFVLSCALHYLPYAPLDLYHDGEHLTPAFFLRSGARPYADVYFNRGFATDGGLDLLVLGHPPSPVRVRLLWTILGAATLVLLAPIAAEVCTTSAGVAAATFGSFCVARGGVLKLFNYFARCTA